MSIETNKHNEVFIRRILTPPGLSIMFAQTVLQLDKISSQRFAQAASEAGWNEEASLIEEEKAQVFVEGIDIALQQAQILANERKAAILVGDAAASASFFEGMGANTAFRTAVLAGDFIADFLTAKNNAYNSFNVNMKNTTDELINKSRYLFLNNNIVL